MKPIYIIAYSDHPRDILVDNYARAIEGIKLLVKKKVASSYDQHDTKVINVNLNNMTVTWQESWKGDDDWEDNDCNIIELPNIN